MAESRDPSEIYINDLAETQSHLEHLQQLLVDCQRDEKSMEFFRCQYGSDEYLSVLNAKQTQWAGIRQKIRINPATPTNTLLREMLDSVEPLIDNMIQVLLRYVSSDRCVHKI